MARDKTPVADASVPEDDSPDYSAPQVKGSEKSSVNLAWFYVVLAGTSLGWFLWKSQAPLFLPSGYPDPLLYFFGPIVLFLIGRAVWETVRLKRFGDPLLELSTGKGTIGGTVEGRLSLGSNIANAPEFTVTLACIRLFHSAGGKHTHKTVLWSAENKATLLLGGILPISFAVPEGQPATKNDDPLNLVLWQLTIKAPFRGVAFLEQYEIPVYPPSK